MSENKPQYPEPEGFQKTIDETCEAVIDGIFRCFTDSEHEQVRAWAEEAQLTDLRPTLAPVIAHYLRSIERQFYQLGYHYGALGRLVGAGNLGERTLVTKHDKSGRIAETVKLPLTVGDRLALEKQQGAAA